MFLDDMSMISYYNASNFDNFRKESPRRLKRRDDLKSSAEEELMQYRQERFKDEFYRSLIYRPNSISN